MIARVSAGVKSKQTAMLAGAGAAQTKRGTARRRKFQEQTAGMTARSSGQLSVDEGVNAKPLLSALLPANQSPTNKRRAKKASAHMTVLVCTSKRDVPGDARSHLPKNERPGNAQLWVDFRRRLICTAVAPSPHAAMTLESYPARCMQSFAGNAEAPDANRPPTPNDMTECIIPGLLDTATQWPCDDRGLKRVA